MMFFMEWVGAGFKNKKRVHGAYFTMLQNIYSGEKLFIQTYYQPEHHAGCLMGSHRPLASLTACRRQKCPGLRNSPSSVLTLYRAGKQKVPTCIQGCKNSST